jgi:hypothetical protein
MRKKKPTLPGKGLPIALLASLIVLGLCAFQYGDNYGLNNLPFAKVQGLASDLEKAQRMAKQGNVDFFAGQSVSGQAVHLRGELTDANCFLGNHNHAYDHAFCAKFCVAAGSPLVFISDSDNKLYVVLTGKNGVKISDDVLDRTGIPGVMVKGQVLEANGLHVLAVEGMER